jgi:hypothetical protein
MQTRDLHELAADIMLELAGSLDDTEVGFRYFEADALRNEASHIMAGCEAPEWALDLADIRMSYCAGYVREAGMN